MYDRFCPSENCLVSKWEKSPFWVIVTTTQNQGGGRLQPFFSLSSAKPDVFVFVKLSISFYIHIYLSHFY